MTLVLDASVALKLFVAEEGSAAAEERAAETDRFIAPELIVAELANAFWRLARVARVTAAQQNAAMERLPGVLDELAPLRGLATLAISISRSLDHPAYDCFYLALCRQRGVSLLTADRRLIARVTGTEWAKSIVPLT